MISMLLAFACLSAGSATIQAQVSGAKNLPILEKWNGDYPVAHLGRLPGSGNEYRVGFIDDPATFAGVWQAFKPEAKVPEVDFKKNLVVYSRNVTFYNRTSIFKVTLKDGVADILAMETMSALPIAETVAMSMVVIPRAGIQFIRAGDQRILVSDGAGIPSATDPLNAAYIIEGKEIHLHNGRFETEAAPGSATKIRTAVFAEPVYGDMDGDGDEDAVLLLTQDPGGSGTFYYIAVAVNQSDGYRGTHAKLLGDRIAPQNITVRNGFITATYADRRPEEPMAALPSVAKSRYLILQNTELKEIRPFSEWIYLDSPLPGAIVDSPLKIQGHARGNWFFEGDFPVVLTDSQGAVIAERFATAKGNWMTEKFVRFEGIIEFNKPRIGDSGTLILKKDNPTGLPQHDDALEIPVFFR